VLELGRAIRDLDRAERSAVAQAPAYCRRLLALDQLVGRSVVVVDEEDLATGTRASPTSDQKHSNRSRGTWESQKPKKTAS
jgi:hypothetical protein